MVLLPLDAFDAALAGSPAFRQFVMANIGSRIEFAPLPSATKCKGLPEQLYAIFVSRLNIVAT